MWMNCSAYLGKELPFMDMKISTADTAGLDLDLHGWISKSPIVHGGTIDTIPEHHCREY